MCTACGDRVCSISALGDLAPAHSMDVTSFSADDFAGSRIRTLHTSPSSEVYTVLCSKALMTPGGTEVVIKRTKIRGQTT